MFKQLSKASGVQLGTLTLPHGGVEVCLDRLASTKQVSDVPNLISGLFASIELDVDAHVCICYDFSLISMNVRVCRRRGTVLGVDLSNCLGVNSVLDLLVKETMPVHCI